MALFSVKFEAVGVGESLLTVAALIGLLAGVSSDVLGQVVPAGEARRAEGALVRLLPTVDQQMVLEVVGADEPLAAYLTAERLDLRVSPLHVVLEVEGRPEGRVALSALVGFLPPVHEDVALHVVHPLGLAAVLALHPGGFAVRQAVAVQPFLAGGHEAAGLAGEELVLLVQLLVQVKPPLRLELSRALVAREPGRLVQLGVSAALVLLQIRHGHEPFPALDTNVGLPVVVRRDVLVEVAFPIEDFVAVSALEPGEELGLPVQFLQSAQVFSGD